jgi:hypothetical protein
MGRPSVQPQPTQNPARLYLQRFRLTESKRHQRDADYDNGGAYWGCSEVVAGEETEPLYRVQGTIESQEAWEPLDDDWWFLCPGGRRAAKAYVRRILPNAIFVRTKRGS